MNTVPPYIDDSIWYSQIRDYINTTTHLMSKSGNPSTGDIPSGRFAVYKNTSTNTVKLWVNDGGTLKSVTLT